MTKKHKKQDDDTNYSFLLKCMAALTAAAVITAGIIAAVTLKSAAVATTAVAAKMMLASAFVFTPIFPIALVVIGLVCVLPFLFGCNNNTYTTLRTTTPGYGYTGYNGYGNYGFYSQPSTHYHGQQSTSVYTPDSHMHGHTTSGTMHGHDTSHVHSHDTSQVHVHNSGGYVHGHH